VCDKITSQNWHHLALAIAGMHAFDEQLKINILMLPTITGQSIG
jgi:hypothetical protein